MLALTLQIQNERAAAAMRRDGITVRHGFPPSVWRWIRAAPAETNDVA
jgi:hypothetical protein